MHDKETAKDESSMQQPVVPNSVTSLDIQSCLAKYMQSANDLSNSYAKLNSDQRLGVTHSLVGILFICLGIAFMFHSMLLSVGNGFIAYGIIEIVGAQGFIDFLKPVNSDGSNYSVFALGFSILLIMQGWGLVGFLLELYSIYMIFRGRCNTSELQMLISIAVNFLRQRVQYLPLLSSLLFARPAHELTPLLVGREERRDPDQVGEAVKITECDNNHRVNSANPSEIEDNHQKDDQSGAELNHVANESLINTGSTKITKERVNSPVPVSLTKGAELGKKDHIEDCDGDQPAAVCLEQGVQSQCADVGHKGVSVNGSDQVVDTGEKQFVQEGSVNGCEAGSEHAMNGNGAIGQSEICGHCLSEKNNVDPHTTADSNENVTKVAGPHATEHDKDGKSSDSVESHAMELNGQTADNKPPSIDNQTTDEAVVFASPSEYHTT